VLVTFEGIEAAGKSTLIATLAEGLGNAGESVLVTREPGGTPLGDSLRSLLADPTSAIDPMAEVMMMNASRAQLVADVISPALRAGTIVLCDRFFDASLAYQGFGRSQDVKQIMDMCLIATRRIAPDLTILIDIPVDVSIARVQARGNLDRWEREDRAFHERVRDGYLELARQFHRIVVLDGTRPPEELAEAALLALAERRVGIHP
jgi:dTMP kinase